MTDPIPATPRTSALNKSHYYSSCADAAGMGTEIPVEQAYGEMYDLACDLERQLSAATSRLAEVERACGQASFCLRELLPNDADAQMTVKMIDAAIQKDKP